jgi:hypothetical protein
MSKFNPGPWTWVNVESDDGYVWGRLDDSANGVVLCSEGPVLPSEASARLIAAAPEMYEMLVGLRDFCDRNHFDGQQQEISELLHQIIDGHGEP